MWAAQARAIRQATLQGTWPARVAVARMAVVRPGWLSVEETRTGHKYQNLITDGAHEVFADEPGHFPGGDDTGMNPYGFLLSALGSCTSITVRLFADREKIPLDRIRLFLKHDRIYAKDCQECVSKTGKVDVISVELELEGNMTPEQRAQLMDVAHRCPVHKTLTSETLVHIHDRAKM